jgi:hypothetical protein
VLVGSVTGGLSGSCRCGSTGRQIGSRPCRPATWMAIFSSPNVSRMQPSACCNQVLSGGHDLELRPKSGTVMSEWLLPSGLCRWLLQADDAWESFSVLGGANGPCSSIVVQVSGWALSAPGKWCVYNSLGAIRHHSTL